MPINTPHLAFKFVRSAVDEAHPELASQAHFGRFLDASGPTVQAIELGKLELSDSLALRTVLRTGANLFDLKRKAAKPRDLWGDTYTPASFRKTLELSKQQPTERSSRHSIAATTRLVSGILAALHHKGQHELALVLLQLQLVKLIERFEVAGTLAELHPDTDYERLVCDCLSRLVTTNTPLP